MDCSPRGSSDHGIFQARILEWVAILFQGIFPTQGSNLSLLRLLHWQGDFLPPAPPGEKAMASHSSTLAWKISWMEMPGRLQSMGSLESDMTEKLHFHFSLSCTGEGNSNPLQCSCLENPRDGGAWWAAVYGVAQSRIQLKWLSSSSCSRIIPRTIIFKILYLIFPSIFSCAY